MVPALPAVGRVEPVQLESALGGLAQLERVELERVELAPGAPGPDRPVDRRPEQRPTTHSA